MIVSDYYLETARRKAIERVPRYDAVLNSDPPAGMHVRVHVLGAERLPPESHLGATLFVLEEGQAGRQNSDTAAGGMGLPLFPNSSDSLDDWQEVEHRHILPEVARDFTSFAHVFVHGKNCQIRVEFYMVDDDAMYGEQTERDLGYAVTTLHDILKSPTEQQEVELMSMDHAASVGRASFGIEWVREPQAVVAFELRVRVNKREGWPFCSSRVFFMLYRKEYDGQWTPLYLSEIREKNTDHPEARNSMLFTIAEVHAVTATMGNDSTLLRIEFFQYKTSRSHHRLLGYVTTSVLQLRHAQPNTDLGMKLNTFTNAELVGRVTLDRVRYTSRRLFFSLQAEFGGPVDANFVYLDFSIAYKKGFFRAQPGVTGGRSVFSSNRPYFQLNRVNADTGDWEVVYRSAHGSSKHSGRKLLKYQLAKVNIAKLGDPSKNLLLSLHSGQSARIGRVRTSLSELLSMSPGEVLPITFRTVPNQGYVVLDRLEWTDNDAYVSLRAVLGEDYNVSDSDGDSGEIVELPTKADDEDSSTDDGVQATGLDSPVTPTPMRTPTLTNNQSS